MKKLLLSLTLGLLTLGTAAAATNHYAVAFNATVFSAEPTGPSSASLNTVKVNNATIINQLVASGSFGNLKASDMDIVVTISGSHILDVIDKTSHTVLFPLVVTGTDENSNADVIYGNALKESAFSDEALQISLPDGSVWNVNSLIRGSFRPTVPVSLTSLSFSFLGGMNQMVIQGIVRKKAKTYLY